MIKKLFFIAVTGISLFTMAESGSDILPDFLTTDSDLVETFKNLPENGKELISWVYDKLGDPQTNFHDGVSGFLSAGTNPGPARTGNVNTQKINEAMDLHWIERGMKNPDKGKYRKILAETGEDE
ncbi:MAG: hypothetical protein PUF37_07735 [Prevotellaceae bacterium]|nr:hypothetical protein [Prevotellaceae bacterium]